MFSINLKGSDQIISTLDEKDIDEVLRIFDKYGDHYKDERGIDTLTKPMFKEMMEGIVSGRNRNIAILVLKFGDEVKGYMHLDETPERITIEDIVIETDARRKGNFSKDFVTVAKTIATNEHRKELAVNCMDRGRIIDGVTFKNMLADNGFVHDGSTYACYAWFFCYKVSELEVPNLPHLFPEPNESARIREEKVNARVQERVNFMNSPLMYHLMQRKPGGVEPGN